MALVIGKTYYIKNVATGKYLNVYGTDTVANSRNVNTYAKEDCLAQKWTVGLYGNGARVYTAINSAYALNINTSNNNCTMYSAASNSEADSVVDFLTVSASNNQYRIKMMAHNKYLSVTTSDNNAYWASSADSYSLWQLEEVSTSTAVVTTAPSTIVNQTFFVKNYNTGYNLNVYGTDTVADGRNVNVHSKENCLAQKWVVRQKSDGAKLCTAINENFTLNIDTTTNNCTMYTESANVSEDCVLEFVPYTDASVSSADRVYRIKMANHNLYLDVESVGSGANAYWVSGTSGYSLWQFVTEVDMFPPAPEVPDAPDDIVDNTYAIQANGTDFYLNVHGTDTVANDRNVNIYSKDDCQAQRWVIKNTDNGPKLFTKIDESFALNIYTVDDNCTMYPHSVENDTDSILEFVSVGSMLYRIKMFHHEKYLCIDGNAESGANVKWLEGASTATVWKLIPEATAFPTPNPAPSTIVDKPFFIRNFNTKYNLNVHGTNTVANGRNVNVFAKEPEDAQRWRVLNTAKGPKIVTEINNSFALNIHVENNNNCTMYDIDASNTDTVLELIPYTDETTTAADKVYRIKMFHHDKYLEAAGVGSGYNVYWSDSPVYNLWQFVEEDDMFPPVEDAPADITDKVFFIQNVNTGHFLNVHGTDTVANTRNVNVYAKEDADAQRWIIRNKDGGPKLVTKIDETFAVNIYANDNNCTMYEEEGNDIDSVLQFIPYTTGQTSTEDGVYRIKMHYHNRYLTVSNTNIGANAWWTSVDSEPYALWRLIPENEMTFETVTPTGADSPLVTKFIPADTSNYTACPDGRTISAITIHHTAGNISIDTLGAMWQDPTENASSHYGVRGTQVGQFVNERDIAWTNKHESNSWCVTIETCNSTGAPNWEVSDDTYYTLVRLVADIAKRNNLGTLIVGENLTYHSFYSTTECPGPYLLARMQDIADRANKINNATYIRKHNTSLYLGVNSNNEIIWTDRDGAKGWNKVESDGEYTFYDIDDASMCLQVADDGVTPILASKDTIAFRVFGIENERGLINLGVVNSMTTYGIIDTVKNWISGILSILGVAVPGVTEDTPDEFTDSEEDMTYSPAVSSELLDKYVRIKYKFSTSDTYYYLTISELDELHSSGNGVKIELLPFDEESPKQIWKIKHYADGLCGLTSFAFPKYSIEIDPSSNAVIANDRSVLDTLTFDGSEIDEQYDKMLRNLSISIIKTTDSEYKIKLSAYDKYLYYYTSSSNASMIWSNAEPVSWDIEEAEYIVVNDWLRLYLNPQNREISHETLVPKYAFRVPYGVITNKADGKGLITYEEHYYNNYTDFIQTSRGTKTIEVEYRAALPEEIEYDSTATEYDYVTAYTKQNSSGKDIKYTFNSNKNWSAFEVKDVVSSYTDTDKYGKDVDDNGVVFATQEGYKDYYYVAVGPKVIKKEYYPDNGTPGNDMYNVCTIDAVLSKDNNLYYIRCLVGDVKGHTWNNGVIQTHYCYYVPKDIKDHGEDKTLTYHEFDTKNIDKCVSNINPEIACLEFIGSNPGNSNFKNYNFEKFVVYNDI